MDPVTIAVAGVFLGGLMLKGVEYLMNRDDAGSVAISDDYEDRWKSPEYVKMIHETRELEIAQDITPTVCECEACIDSRRPPRRVSNLPIIKPRSDHTITPLPSGGEMRQSDNRITFHHKVAGPELDVRIVGGYVHNLTNKEVPKSARFSAGKSLDIHVVLWSWYEVGGKEMGYRTLSLTPASEEDLRTYPIYDRVQEQERYEVYSDESPEPIKVFGGDFNSDHITINANRMVDGLRADIERERRRLKENKEILAKFEAKTKQMESYQEYLTNEIIQSHNVVPIILREKK